ncbi:MAG TPA: hypothetical protein PLV45_09950, partial [bacterium]|nr:hypothetical protein [bacterium]
MKNYSRISTILAWSIVMAFIVPVAGAASPDFWGGPAALDSLKKVEPLVLSNMENEGRSDFFIVLSEQADLSGAAKIFKKVDKGRYVFRELNRVADRTQPQLIAQ